MRVSKEDSKKTPAPGLALGKVPGSVLTWAAEPQDSVLEWGLVPASALGWVPVSAPGSILVSKLARRLHRKADADRRPRSGHASRAGNP